MMDFVQWLRLVGIVVAGNILTGMLIYSLYVTFKAEREGKDTWRLPAKVYLAAIIPIALVIWSVWMTD